MASTTAPTTDRGRVDGDASADSSSLDSEGPAVVLAAASIVLLVVARGWVLWSQPSSSGDVNQWVTTSPYDWPLAMLVGVQITSVLRARSDRAGLPTARRQPLVVVLLAATLVWMAFTALLEPSWRGLDLAFHLAGAWALVRTVRRAGRAERTALLTVLVGLGVVQAGLGIAQSRTGDIIGLGPLEFDGPLYTFGDAHAGRGSLTHPYHLTALLVVCAAAASVVATRLAGTARRLATAALVVIGVAIPLTFSRAAIVAVVPMIALWAWRPTTRALAVAFAVGLALGLALGLDGVSAKAERTVDVDSADSGRRQRVEEALRLMDDHPLTGVGPGRYVIALRDVDHDDLLPPHNIALHAGAESGVPGLALTVGTLAAFGLWLVRRRPLAIAAGLSLLPFHLLDSYPHVFPVGITISGLWIGVTLLAADAPRAERAER